MGNALCRMVFSVGGGLTVAEDDLRTFLEYRLVLYKTPRTHEFVINSLRDDAGKIRRPQLVAERMTERPQDSIESR